MTENRPQSSSGKRAFWTKQFYLWHWVSSALSLAGMLFFAVTGITLNHAGQIGATPKVVETRETLPPALLQSLQNDPVHSGRHAVPAAIVDWISETMGVSVAGHSAQWSDLDLHVDLPRPGGDAWLNIDRETGVVTHELTSRGFISYLNDLHKGRHTGFAWMIFLDVFSVACVVFCLTGLALLYVHARRRPTTWPIVIAGILLPVLLIIAFIH
jgi:hypothetical protein